jgi:hypothetical protein
MAAANNAARKSGGARASPNQLSFYYLFDIKRLVFQAL